MLVKGRRRRHLAGAAGGGAGAGEAAPLLRGSACRPGVLCLIRGLIVRSSQAPIGPASSLERRVDGTGASALLARPHCPCTHLPNPAACTSPCKPLGCRHIDPNQLVSAGGARSETLLDRSRSRAWTQNRNVTSQIDCMVTFTMTPRAGAREERRSRALPAGAPIALQCLRVRPSAHWTAAPPQPLQPLNDVTRCPRQCGIAGTVCRRRRPPKHRSCVLCLLSGLSGRAAARRPRLPL